jgi:hypothetical protein
MPAYTYRGSSTHRLYSTDSSDPNPLREIYRSTLEQALAEWDRRLGTVPTDNRQMEVVDSESRVGEQRGRGIWGTSMDLATFGTSTVQQPVPRMDAKVGHRLRLERLAKLRTLP